MGALNERVLVIQIDTVIKSIKNKTQHKKLHNLSVIYYLFPLQLGIPFDFDIEKYLKIAVGNTFQTNLCILIQYEALLHINTGVNDFVFVLPLCPCVNGPKPVITHPSTLTAISIRRGCLACKQTYKVREGKLLKYHYVAREHVRNACFIGAGSTSSWEMRRGGCGGMMERAPSQLGVGIKVKGLWVEAEARRLMGMSLCRNGIFLKLAKCTG